MRNPSTYCIVICHLEFLHLEKEKKNEGTQLPQRGSNSRPSDHQNITVGRCNQLSHGADKSESDLVLYDTLYE